MKASLVQWVENELQYADLNDERLTKRCKVILIGLMNKAQATICSTFRSWVEIKLCYRFLNNDKVTQKKLRFSHQK